MCRRPAGSLVFAKVGWARLPAVKLIRHLQLMWWTRSVCSDALSLSSIGPRNQFAASSSSSSLSPSQRSFMDRSIDAAGSFMLMHGLMLPCRRRARRQSHTHWLSPSDELAATGVIAGALTRSCPPPDDDLSFSSLPVPSGSSWLLLALPDPDAS